MTGAFHQAYDPVAGSVLLSALVAALPLVVLAVLLAVVRAAPWKAAVAGAATAFALAWLVWRMPLGLAVSAATHGMAFGLWPISWVVLNAVFFYNLTVASGDFDVIRRSLARLTDDRRIQALLVAFCFGALVEGIAGFGAPVAISAAMLAGLGFEPVAAAVLALVANTAPVAFGSIGIPVTTLGGLLAPILGRDVASTTRDLSAMVGRQLPFFSLLVPAYLVVLLAGWRRMVEVLPAVVAAGAELRPRAVRRLELRRPGADRHPRRARLARRAGAAPARVAAARGVARRGRGAGPGRAARPAGARRAGLRDLRDPRRRRPRSARCAASAGLKNVRWETPWPGSYAIGRRPRGAARPPRAADRGDVDALSAPLPPRRPHLGRHAGARRPPGSPSSSCWPSARRPPRSAITFARTLRQLKLPIVTIAFILSIATVMNYSGMTSSMALALAATGVLFPFFSAFIGMLGVFLTGSDTSSNTLFGPLQATTAKVSGLDPILMAATNSSGGVMGKMISPQNLSVGAAGVGAVGREGEIFRRVIGHSLVLTSLMGLLAMLQAYVVPWMVP